MLVLLMGSLMAASLIYFVPVVQKSIGAAMTNLTKYMQSESADDDVRWSSLGTSLEMWKAELKMSWESQVFATRRGGYQEQPKENLEKYFAKKSAASFYHPHNLFVWAFATRGLFGLLFLLVLLLYSVFLVWLLKASGKANMGHVFAGMLIALSYIVFSLTDVPLEGKPTILFYSVAISYILANVRTSVVHEKLVD